MKFVYKPAYRLFHHSSGLWRWSVRRFTPAGLCVAGGWIVAGCVGADIDNTVTYQSFALLLAFLVFAMACSFFFRGTFAVTRSLPRFGTAGQPLQYHIQVTNRTRRTQAGLTIIDDLADPRPSFEEWLAFERAESRRIRPFRVTDRRRRSPFRQATLKPAAAPPILPHGEASVAMELMPLRRGVLRFTGVTVACADPLGLFRSLIRVNAPQTVLILPRRYALPAIALPGETKYQQGGVALAANVGRNEEFMSLREYRHGDPIRHIHWRSWAKTGKPIVKEFEDEFFVRHALILDTFSDEPHSPILEEAVSVAASFACTVLTQESLLDLLFVGNKSYCFTAGRGLGTADQMLEILASAQNVADKPFSDLENLVLGHISAVSGCVCILQKWDRERRDLTDRLRSLGIPMLILVIVPPGGTLPKIEGSSAETPAGVHVLEAGKITDGLARLATHS